MTGPADERWSRLEGVVDRDTLSLKHALVVGLGSGGSTVALELAKAGVGRFTLIDPDHVDLTNLIRHECDDRYVGWNKAEAVADLMRRRNPEVAIDICPSDAFDLGTRLEEIVTSVDLVAACTDGESPKNLLNRLSTMASIPAVYGGVYERASGGEVIRCFGGAGDACYACVTSVLKDEIPAPDPGELDYGLVASDGTVTGAPGLGLDVRIVALIHAKICLLTLMGAEEPSGNVVLFGTTRVDGLFPAPFASALLQISPQEGCLVCRPIREFAEQGI